MPQLTPTLEEHLLTWLPLQRWFGAQEPVALTRVGGLVLPDPTEKAQYLSYLYKVSVEQHDGGTIIHVPIVIRDEAAPEQSGALIGQSQRTSRRNPSIKYFYDGTADAGFVTAWLRFIHDADKAYADRVLGQPSAGFGLWPDLGNNLTVETLAGEQTNTSVVIHGSQEPLLLKFFRTITPGKNSDVALGIALDTARSTAVATTYGTISATWLPAATEHQDAVPVHISVPEPLALTGKIALAEEPTPNTEIFDLVKHFTVPEQQLEIGHVCVLRKYYPGAQDAWEMASLAAVRGQDFTANATSIGEVLAQLHQDFVTALGEQQATAAQRQEFFAELISRLNWGYAQAKEIIGNFDEVMAELTTQLNTLSTQDPEEPFLLQTIHSDAHLGQFIATEEDGWKVVDFEGEPLRDNPREGQDLILRDLAGLLRSFDYAAALAHRVYFADQKDQDPAMTEEAATQWVAQCSQAFLAGYSRAAGKNYEHLADGVLGQALLLDKAFYEVAYEKTHRQEWAHVPALAAQRLLRGRAATAANLQKESA